MSIAISPEMEGALPGTNAGAAPSAPARRRAAAQKTSATIPIALVISLMIPVYIMVGSFNMSASRMFLLLMFPVAMVTYLSSDLRRGRIFDMLLIGHVVWVALSLAKNHGLSFIYQSIGTYFIECLGAYMIGRVFVRNAEQFRKLIAFMFLSIACLLPFLIVEMVTGQRPLLQFFGIFGTVPDPNYEVRMGLVRAWGVFNHSILLGVFCASLFSLTVYVVSARSGRMLTFLNGLMISVAAFTPLSSGALLILAFQIGLTAWDWFTRAVKSRWLMITGGLGGMYVVLDLLSNRTPFELVANYASLKTASAVNRIRIWNYGTAEVGRNPIFGIGDRNWDRPDWMLSSIDNFWLVVAMRSGLPAVLLLMAVFIGLCLAVSQRRFFRRDLTLYRRGWIFCIVGLVIAGGTVHFFGTALPQVMLLLGAGVWFLDADGRNPGTAGAAGPGGVGVKPAPAFEPARVRPSGMIPIG